MTIQKRVMFFFVLLMSVSLACCNEKGKPEDIRKNGPKESATTADGIRVDGIIGTATHILDKNIRSIYQDTKGNYWFGTNGAGVYRYDGKLLTQFTVSEGLPNNQIQRIQEDDSGNLWFDTGAFGVSRFDGQSFTTFTDEEYLQTDTGAENQWIIEQNDLWFYAGGGAFRCNGQSLVYAKLSNPNSDAEQSQSSPFSLSRYAVYSILEDRKGNRWFGTQAEGVCRFDGKTFTWFTEKGLSDSAVLCLFEDSRGNLWFGNNGSGLFRWDGKSVTNLTEEMGLSNSGFKASGKSGPGTLARIYSMNEDNFGNLWIGTVDAGVWKYDGSNLVNYTTQNGLPGNAVNCIYKDRAGELWFGTDSYGICTFNGNSFVPFSIERKV